MKVCVTTENDFQSQIIELARILGWKIAHFRPARTKTGWRTAVAGDGSGFPDCCIVKPPRVIFAELKSNKGKLSAFQEHWLNLLKQCPGVEVYLWRPDDIEDVARILQSRD